MSGSKIQQMIRHAGPAMGFSGWRLALGAGGGILLSLLLLELALAALPGDAARPLALMMIAPFGASAVLLFALPNSPLAQPWSALVGNMVSALVAVLVLLVVADPMLRLALATGFAVFAMILARALHPPGGAVALTAALNPDMIDQLGFLYVLAPVGLGTAAMIVLAVLWARLSGRHYPFRQPADLNPQGTKDSPATERIGLSPDELAAILQEFRQSANIGVEDLARLIGAAETQASLHRFAGVTAGAIMSRDLVTVTPQTPLRAVAELFRRHGFTSLPVVTPDMQLCGVIFQIHLIRRGAEESRRIGLGFVAAFARLLMPGRKDQTTAAQIMQDVAHLPPEAPLQALLAPLAQGDCDAVPVVERGRILGIVTRTDLIAALARGDLQPPSFTAKA